MNSEKLEPRAVVTEPNEKTIDRAWRFLSGLTPPGRMDSTIVRALASFIEEIEAPLREEIETRLDLQASSGGLYLKLAFSARIDGACFRCLEPASLELDVREWIPEPGLLVDLLTKAREFTLECLG